MSHKIRQIAVGSNEWDVWVLDTNGRLWSVNGSKWVLDQDARAVALAVDGHDIVWNVNSDGQIWYKGKSEKAWHEKSLPNIATAQEIASGHNVTIARDASSNTWRYEYGGSGWVHVPGSALHVASGFGDADQYCVNSGGTFYKYNLMGKKWDQHSAHLPIDLNQKVIGLEMGWGTKAGTKLFCLGGDVLDTHGHKIKGSGHIYQPDDKGGYASDPFSNAIDFAVTSIEDIWTVNSGGSIHRRTRHNTVHKKLTVGSATPRVVNGVSYDWQETEGPDLTRAAFHWEQKVDTHKNKYWQKTPGPG